MANGQQVQPEPKQQSHPVHPAVQNRNQADAAQKEIQIREEENQRLQQQIGDLNQAGQRISADRDQLASDMMDPNIDSNVAPAPDAQGPNGPEMGPIDALYDGVSQGASLEEMADVGMLEPAIAEMQKQGFTEDDQTRMLQELDTLSKAPSTSAGGPYNMSGK